MKFFSRKKEAKSFTEAERKMLDLLLQGESAAFDKLRRQCGPPLLLWVERESSAERYSIDLVFDASVREQYTIGESNSMNIDDLYVIDKRLRDPFQCEASLTHGILGNVICTAPSPVRWPKELNVDDWFYTGPNGERTRTRVTDWDARFAAARPRPLAPEVEAALPGDYRDYMGRPDRRLATARATLLHLDEIHFLDHDRIPGKLLVFAKAVDGNLFAFKPGAEVYEVDRETLEVTRVARSFTEWLEGARNSARP